MHYEYTPTQMFTEFLRWRLLPEGQELDGIIYRSAHGAGRNIVLFAGPAGCLPDSDLPDSVTRQPGEEQVLALLANEATIRIYGPPPSKPQRGFGIALT
ncbi:MAG: RES domain-containing protein [Acidimicrobiales bacterium]